MEQLTVAFTQYVCSTISSSTLTASGNVNDGFTFLSPFQNNPTSFIVSPPNALFVVGVVILIRKGNITGTLT